MKVITVFEVYEHNTNRCIVFLNKEDAENQDYFNEVDFVTKSAVKVSDEELKILNDGGFVFAD